MVQAGIYRGCATVCGGPTRFRKNTNPLVYRAIVSAYQNQTLKTAPGENEILDLFSVRRGINRHPQTNSMGETPLGADALGDLPCRGQSLR